MRADPTPIQILVWIHPPAGAQAPRYALQDGGRAQVFTSVLDLAAYLEARACPDARPAGLK